MAVEEHKARAPERVNCFVVTVSDTRTEATDFSGALVKELLETNFHHVVGTQIVKDEPAQIRTIAERSTGHERIQVVFFTGGTGVSTRDNTSDVLEKMFDKRIEGFGELFRNLSYQDIGPSAMLSGATAGVLNGRLVFALPGAESAVGLAMRELILPELGHLVYEVNKEEFGVEDGGDEGGGGDEGVDEDS